jgi:hypothetical protein
VLSLLGAAPGARAANRAISCDGVDDFAIASFSPLVSTSTFTVEVWARPDAFSSFGSVASASDGYAVGAAGDARFTIGPGSTVTASGGSLTLGEWVHLAGTYDGTTVRVFVDGQPVGSEIKPDMAVVSLINFKFCVWPNGGAFFQGAVDEMRIWDHVRTDEEIASAHAESLPGDEPGLLAYYRFDEPGEQTIVDSSPNGRNGTLGADASVASDDPTRIEPGAPVPEAGGGSLVLLTLAALSQRRGGRRATIRPRS